MKKSLATLSTGVQKLGTRRHFASKFVATVTPRISYVHSPDSRTLSEITTGQLVDHAADRYGDRLVTIDCAQGIRKTFTEYKIDIDQFALGLLALNLQKGDRIGIWCPNMYEWGLTQMAAAKAGLILVSINPIYTAKELEYCIHKLGIRALVMPETFKTQNYYDIVTKLIPEVVDSMPGQIKSKKYPSFDTIITISNNTHPGTFRMKDVMTAGGSREKEKLDKLQTEIGFDDPVNIQFTSGTTGQPKAATLTHFSCNNSCMAISDRMGYFNEPARICSNVPLFHCFGSVGVNLCSVIAGTTAVFPAPGFSPQASLKVIEQEKCTVIYGTPTMYVDILNHPNFSKTNLTSIKAGVMAGAPCPPELLKEVTKRMNCPGLIVGYGATETSPIVSCHFSNKEKEGKIFENVGMVMPNTEVKIVDANDRIVPLGNAGEICARGFHIMKGFWGDEEKTKEVIRDGWYHTGDIGYLTEDGYLQVIGRSKDMVIRGGEKLFPKEIEDILLSHPKISEAYVIGVPDKRLGEELCTWIKLKDKETLTENEVREFCKDKISNFKIPKYIRFVTDYPKTASGKVQKYVIREEMIKLLEKQ